MKFSTEKEYIYNKQSIGKFKYHRPLKEKQYGAKQPEYIWNGYAYFDNNIVHYSNYELIFPKP